MKILGECIVLDKRAMISLQREYGFLYKTSQINGHKIKKKRK